MEYLRQCAVTVRLVLLLVVLGCITPALGDQPAWRQGLADMCFEVLVDGRRTAEYVILTVHVSAAAPEQVDAHAAFLREDAARQATRISVRSYSSRDTSITGVEVAGDTLRFEILLDGRDADRKIRVRSIRDHDSGSVVTKASGLWSDQTHTTFVRAQWKPVDSLELRFPRLLPSGGF